MPDRLFPKNGIWYTWTYDEHGSRVQRSTRCKLADRKKAEEFARDLDRRASRSDHGPTEKATLVDALELLVADRRRSVLLGKRSAETLAFYKKKTGTLRRLFGDAFKLRALRSTDVDAYVDKRLAEDVTASTIAKELGALRAALKLAKRARIWKGDLGEVLPVDFSPEYKPRTRWLPLAELDRLLAALAPGRAARVAFIVATSARWGEADRAERRDVRPWRVHLRGTKTEGAERDVPLVAEWQQRLIERALEGGSSTGRLFARWTNVRRDMHAACKVAGIAPCSPNDLRRTTAHLLRAAGAQLPDVADVLGHADTRMVERVYGRRGVDDLAASLARGAGLLH
jgi:integrase